MYCVDFILNYPNRCIIGVKNLMTIVWKIRIYYYLRSNILMLRLICDHWFLMLDKCGVYVRVSREVSITAGITNSRSRDFCSFFCVKMLADVGTLGTDPAKFCGLRLLQSDKIG